MKINNSNKRILIFLEKFKKISIFSIFISLSLYADRSPKLTLILIIDQFSPLYLEKHRSFLNGGIGFLLKNGTVYKNTFCPNGMPGTAPGHTMLSTGTYADYHGIIGNKWYDPKGNRILCDEDTPDKAGVFKSDGSTYNFGKSAKNILVDGLSDQLIINSYPHATNKVWALSIKSRTAVSTASRLGKAIWFDDEEGRFTSSKAYFDKLPKWLENFNKNQKINLIKEFSWKPLFSDAQYYNYKFSDNYLYTRLPSILEKTLTINPQIEEKFEELYTSTPDANKRLVMLARECIENNLPKNDSERLILWLSISSLDKIGHKMGPDSKEAIDMIYQIDQHLDTLIKYIYSKINKEDVLFILTADHGIQPIPEILQDIGFDISRRYYSKDLINEMNKRIKEKFGIDKIIKVFKNPAFYLDQSILDKISIEIKNNIFNELKEYLMSLDGMHKVWTFEELSNAIIEPTNPDIYLKHQLYRGRSGQLIYATQPYTLVDNHKKGASHSSQYAYTTQVPLIFYQPEKFEKKIISQNVFTLQIPITLANILNIPRPSASTANVLPTS